MPEQQHTTGTALFEAGHSCTCALVLQFPVRSDPIMHLALRGRKATDHGAGTGAVLRGVPCRVRLCRQGPREPRRARLVHGARFINAQATPPRALLAGGPAARTTQRPPGSCLHHCSSDQGLWQQQQQQQQPQRQLLDRPACLLC